MLKITLGRYAMNKLKTIFITIGSVIVAIGAAVLAFVLLKQNGGTTIIDLKKAFKVKKNDEGTEKLPKTPELNKTLDDIEKDIS